MNTYKQIKASVLKGDIAPIYFFSGTEPYFIDELINLISLSMFPENEESFDKHIFYGKEDSIERIIETAKKYPFLVSKQLIVVKEAQHLEKSLEKSISYFEKPNPSSVLIIAFKNKTVDKRKKIYQTIIAKSVFLETKTLYENQISTWIQSKAKELSIGVNLSVARLLTDFLGADLSKIANELEKLKLHLKENESVTIDVVEKHIGISREYNNFELQKAIATKNLSKAIQIGDALLSNPKNSIIVIISVLFNFFQKLLLYHSLPDKSQFNAAKKLSVNPYFVNEYEEASRHFGLHKTISILQYVFAADLKSKGVGAGNIQPKETLKELIINIILK